MIPIIMTNFMHPNMEDLESHVVMEEEVAGVEEEIVTTAGQDSFRLEEVVVVVVEVVDVTTETEDPADVTGVEEVTTEDVVTLEEEVTPEEISPKNGRQTK